MKKLLSPSDRRIFLKRALRAADWFANSQLGSHRPRWNADRGRFLYYYFIPGKKYVPGINWTQGRGLFTVTEAYKITRNLKYLRAAQAAADYVSALQVTDPRFKKTLGTIKEHTPQDIWAGALDGAQAASGFLMLYEAARNREYLLRGKSFCDYLMRNFRPEKGGFPSGAGGWPVEKVEYQTDWTIHHCTSMPLWHLYRITGDKRLLRPVVWAADAMLRSQQADGSFFCRKDIRKLTRPEPNQHEGRGKGMERYLIRNDDGMVVIFLAAFKATGKLKYLDSMVSYAEWMMKSGPLTRPFCGFPVQASSLLDIGKAAKKDFSPWVLDNLKRYLLDLQVSGSGDPKAEGGFRGEDEENEGGIFGGQSLDYVPARNTCYAAGALFRLSGRGTGAGFSVSGLGR